MNSLEFIEKEIEDRKENVKHWEKQLERYPNDEVFTRGLNKSKEQLETLQQIKAELEAWYSIKQGIKLCESKMYEDSYYEYLQFDEELFDESESEDACERLTPIKKVLEAEDE